MKPITKHIGPYCGSNKPNTKNDVVAVKLVKRIMHADDAEATPGCTSIANISGPLTIPPPTAAVHSKRKICERQIFKLGENSIKYCSIVLTSKHSRKKSC